MSFLSPLELLEAPERNLDGEELRQAVRRARRRWLSEFQLSDELTIGPENVRLDKDALLRLLEVLDDERQARMHRELYHHALYDFLSGKSQARGAWPVRDEELRAFSEPFFTEVFLTRYKNLFLQKDYDRVLLLSAVFSPAGKEKETVLMEELRSFFHTRLLRLNGMVGELKREKKLTPELEELLSVGLVSFWNRVPANIGVLRNALMRIYFDFYSETVFLPEPAKYRRQIMSCVNALELDADGNRWRQQLYKKHI